MPERFRQPLVRLGEIDEDEAQALHDLFYGHHDVTSRRAVRDQMVERAPSLSKADAGQIMSAVFGWAAAWQDVGRDLNKAVARMLANLDGVPDEAVEVLTRRFTDLVKSPVAQLLGKAGDLQTEHERVYTSSRIVTDLRPVFQGEDVAPPAAYVVWHSLHVRWYRGAQPDDQGGIELALDATDLQQLKRQVERAIEKERSLSEMLQKSDLVRVDPLEDMH